MLGLLFQENELAVEMDETSMLWKNVLKCSLADDRCRLSDQMSRRTVLGLGFRIK